MPAWTSRAVALAVVTVAALQVPGAPRRGESPRRTVSFNDIAPIVYSHCAPCHRPGQAAPFSLLAYADVRQRARLIALATKSRVMPPWPPEAGYGDFTNQRRLSNDAVDLIQRWVADGAIEGDPRTLPLPPTWTEGWQLGRPDLVLQLAHPYALQAAGTDVFRNFVIPLSLTSAKYVRGVEFRPVNPRLVHHAVIRVDRTRTARSLDLADAEPGYDGMLAGAADSPDGRFLGWTPGKAPSIEPDGMAWRLDPGTDVVVHAHLLPTGKPESVQFQIGLFFIDTPPTRVPFMLRLGSQAIDIPAGRKEYAVSDTYVLPADVQVLSVYPHAHYLAKDIKGFATLPDGSRKWLVWIKDWNFNWQDVYLYATPIALPRGTTIAMQYTYDNSADNVRNPFRPPRPVVYGPRSSDEMADLWLQVLPSNPADFATLERVHNERELNFVIAGTEKRVQSAPDDVAQRIFLAARYLEAGRIAAAVAQLEEALRLEPRSAEARSNLGSALRRQGRLADAVAQFREAISINPRLAEAHNNLGVALAVQGNLAEAVLHFRQAVQIQPDYSDARTNLGLGLRAQGKAEEAIAHLRRALEINPRDEEAQKALSALVKR